MTGAVAREDAATRRRRLLRLLVIGVVLTLPRFALAFFAGPATDALQVASVLLLVVGVALIASALIRLWALRSDRLLPVVGAGVAALVLAFVVISLRPPGTDQVAYTGGLLAPAPAVAFGLLYLLVAAVSQLGLFLLLGSIGVAVTRWAARRASR